MRKMCGNIFEDRKRRNVQLNLNVHRRFSQIFRLYDDIYIGIYAESFKSIGMLAYRVSFCCCQSKVCSDTFVKKIHRVSYNMGAC